jgi:cytochrome c556
VDITDYRQNVMKTLGAQAGAVCMILQQNAPSSDLGNHLKALAQTSAQVIKAFEPHAEGGDAKTKIWRSWDDFVAKANDQAETLAALDSAVESGGLTAAEVRESFNCKACHDRYRVERGKRYCRDMTSKQRGLIFGKSGTTPAVANFSEEDSIDYRRHNMKAIDAQTAALGQILSLVVTDVNFVSHLEVIATHAQMALPSFEKEAVGGEALPRVWEDWDDFAAKMNAFADEIASTAQFATENSKDMVIDRLINALPCKQCHDDYRKKE